jgi:hypothetical protein
MDHNIIDILKERGTTHGAFKDNSETFLALWKVVESSRNYEKGLDDVKKFGLMMILGKVSRLLSGDSDHIDNYDDIAGYAILIKNEINSTMERGDLK